MKKYSVGLVVTAVVLAVILILLASAFKPINSLMKPPKVDGENLNIQLAFEESVGDKYLLKQPISGNYRSAYTFIDLDSDNDDEVIVFYSRSDALDIVRMNVLDKDGDKWQSIADFESLHNQIQEIEFSDLNGDKFKEIIVGWTPYSGDYSKLMSVYEFSKNGDGFSITPLFDNSYSQFMILDIDCNDVSDILCIKHNATLNTAEYNVSFLTYGKNGIEEQGGIVLDRSISSITSIAYDYDDITHSRRIYVDGYKIDSGMATDCVAWSDNDKAFVRYGDGLVSLSAISSRSSVVSCADIDSDGIIEVPTEEILPASNVITAERTENIEQSLIRWIKLTNSGKPETVQHRLINSVAGYSLVFDESWLGKVTVENDQSSGVVTFCELNNIGGQFVKGAPLFSLKTVSEETSVTYFSTYYDYLANNKGQYYYCRIFGKGEDFGITYKKIKNSMIMG